MSTQPSASSLPPVVMEPHEWAIVVDILREFAAGRTVWAYGSRATGRRVKRYSDLDLAVGGPPFARGEEATLDEAFDESRLPFKVEFQRLEAMSEEFRSRIEKDLVVLQAGEADREGKPPR